MSVGAVYVPNRFHIHLCPEDFERFEGLLPTLRQEFVGLLARDAAERRWHFPGALVVDFLQDEGQSTGRFQVVAEHDASVQAPLPAPGPREVVRLTGAQPPKVWVLTGSRMVIGRLPACEVSLGDANASRQHAELVQRDGEWWIADLGSTNGTLVNGGLVRERRLMPGDRIQIGSSKLEYGIEEAPPPAPAPPVPEPDATQAASFPDNFFD